MAETPRAADAANPYENPELFRFLGSMEGVPEPETTGPLAWRDRCQALLDTTARVLPGVAIAGLLAFFAFALTRWIGVAGLGFARTPLPLRTLSALGGNLVATGGSDS